MKMQLIGIGKRRSGTSSKNGKPYDFTALYGIYTSADVAGHMAEEIFFSHLSNVIFPEMAVGDIIDISYDKRGFMQEISIIEKSTKAAAK